jgi:hypothetical protein
MAEEKTIYYKFDVGSGLMRKTGARFESLGKDGKWFENPGLFRRFLGGDMDFEEIPEEEARRIADRKRQEFGNGGSA